MVYIFLFYVFGLWHSIWKNPSAWVRHRARLLCPHKWHNVQCTFNSWNELNKHKITCNRLCEFAHQLLLVYTPWRQQKMRAMWAPFPSAHITCCAHLPKAKRELSGEIYILFMKVWPYFIGPYLPRKMWIQGVSHDKPFPTMTQVLLTLKTVDLIKQKIVISCPMRLSKNQNSNF